MNGGLREEEGAKVREQKANKEKQSTKDPPLPLPLCVHEEEVTKRKRTTQVVIQNFSSWTVRRLQSFLSVAPPLFSAWKVFYFSSFFFGSRVRGKALHGNYDKVGTGDEEMNIMCSLYALSFARIYVTRTLKTTGSGMPTSRKIQSSPLTKSKKTSKHTHKHKKNNQPKTRENKK